MPFISVLIVDDQAVFADAVGARLQHESDMEPVVVTYGLEEAAARLPSFSPDVAVIDLRLADGSGLDLVRRARSLSPNTRVIILSAVESTEAATEAMLMGVRVWLPKSVDTQLLVQTVRAAHRGEAWLPRWMLGPVLDGLVNRATGVTTNKLDLLSHREAEILTCLSYGMTRSAIADELHLSINTVRTHVQNTISKLGVHSTLEAVAQYNRARQHQY